MIANSSTHVSELLISLSICAVVLLHSSGAEPPGPVTPSGPVITSAAFSPDGARLITGNQDGIVAVWNPNTGAQLQTLKGAGGPMDAVALSANGRLAAAADRSHGITVWQAERGTKLADALGHSEAVTCLSFSPDSKKLASGSLDCSTGLWNPETGKKAFLAAFRFHVYKGEKYLSSEEVHKALGVPPSRLPSGVAYTLPGMFIPEFSLENKRLWSVAFSPDNRTLAIGGEEGCLMLLDTSKQRGLRIAFDGHSGTVTCCAFSPDGTRLISGSKDSTVKVWDVSKVKKDETLAKMLGNLMNVSKSDAPITSACISPDGSTIASASRDKTVVLWNASTFKESARFRGLSSFAVAMAIEPNSKALLAVGEDGILNHIDLVSRELKGAIRLGGNAALLYRTNSAATTAPRSDMAAPKKTTRERLDELLKLYINGKMSETEYKQQREKVLATPEVGK